MACGSSAHLAYLSGLQRFFDIETAVTLENAAGAGAGMLFAGYEYQSHGMPMLTVDKPAVQTRLLNGLSQRVPGVEQLEPGTICRAVSAQGQLLAIGTAEGEAFQPNKVFKCGETGE